MARLDPNAEVCGKRTGPEVGLLCARHEGRCPICDSQIDLIEEAHICGDCSVGDLKEQCLLCRLPGVSKAYYCRECVLLGRSREGCPRITNPGLSANDRAFDSKRLSS